MKRDKRLYMAIAVQGGWAVGYKYLPSMLEMHRCGNVRTFDTFEEADAVARGCADGDYNQHPGRYVCNR